MTKSELIDLVAKKLPNMNKRDVVDAVNALFDAMGAALARNDRIEVRGFGSFMVKHRTEHHGRNPKTGESVVVPPKRVPFFTVGKEFKKAVDNAGQAQQKK